VDAALIEKFLANDAFSVSTLAREEAMFIYAGRAPYLDDPFLTEHLPDSVVQTLASPEFQATHINNPELGEWEPALRTAQQNLKTLFDGGVKIGFGSDSGPVARFEGYFEHREMELMAEAGLTPDQIIQIASRNSAEILQIENDYGTIEPGKMAELLVLGANPLENISNTKTLEEVWQNGRRIHDLR
jgi:imidazolonepropionase-like amidohydrolase